MREMKDSGIEWIGEIPKDWDIVRLKFVCQVLDEFQKPIAADKRPQDSNELYDYYGASGVIDKINGYTIDDDVLLIGEDGANLLLRNLPLIYQVHGKAWINNHAHILKPRKRLSCNFAYHMLESLDLTTYITGSAQPKFSQSSLQNIFVILPPTKQQRLIANTLDNKCAEIDALIQDIQSQIGILQQYKQSVITEAVTKGLDPDVEEKDSGIEWIGEVPSHWSIHPVYFYFGERKHKNILGKESNLLSLSYGRIIRKNINTNEGLLPESFNTYNIVEAGDIIIRPTDLQNDKRSLRTGLVREHGIITSAYIDLYPLKKIDSRFFHYQLHCFDIKKVFYNMGNGVRQGLNYSEFSRLKLLEPLYEEQTQIANYLDIKCAEIDEIIDEKRNQLTLLADYKKSLIYEYVTGKKEVPSA